MPSQGQLIALSHLLLQCRSVSRMLLVTNDVAPKVGVHVSEGLLVLHTLAFIHQEIGNFSSLLHLITLMHSFSQLADRTPQKLLCGLIPARCSWLSQLQHSVPDAGGE